MRTIIRTGLLALILGFAACGDADTNQSGEVNIKEEVHDVNKQDVDEAKKLNDKDDNLESVCSDFVTQAAHEGDMDMEMSTLAAQKASTEPVKAFAKSMMQDHSKANAELKELAAKKGLVLPTEAEKNDHDKLGEKKGEEFDKAYMDMMVAHHKKTVDLFEDASEKCEDADIKSYASKHHEILKKHLQTAETINEALKKR